MPRREQTSLSRTPRRARESSDTPGPFKLLVPLDGSELSDDIRPYVRALSEAKTGRVILLHVLPDLTNETTDVVAQASRHAQDYLTQFKRDLGTMSRTEIQFELRMGDPATEILKLAVLTPVNMIAMPTHGPSGFEKLVTGSVTEEVMCKSHCPMLLLHSSGQGAAGKMQLLRPFSRILVAIGDTNHDDHILPCVEDLASTFNSKLVLFHNDAGANSTAKPLGAVAVNQKLRVIQSRLDKAGLKTAVVETHSGKTPDEIIREAEEYKIDLIAMTTHGRRGPDRITYGSVTEEVLRHCTRPLLVQCVTPAKIPETDNEPTG